MEEKFHNIEFDNDFSGKTLRVQATKEKIDQLDCIQIRIFLCFKGHYQL